MDTKIIARVQAFGFDVYMRRTTDTYLYFTDGKRIGYLQDSRYGGLSWSTVHKPNRITGTGFRMSDPFPITFSKDDLEKCFAIAPRWAFKDRQTVRKYRDMEDFRQESDWSRGYGKVERQEVGHG